MRKNPNFVFWLSSKPMVIGAGGGTIISELGIERHVYHFYGLTESDGEYQSLDGEYQSSGIKIVEGGI